MSNICRDLKVHSEPKIQLTVQGGLFPKPAVSHLAAISSYVNVRSCV